MWPLKPSNTGSNIKDPLRRFPYDVWVNCICFSAYGEIAGPLSLLSVSQAWQRSIIETPEAWTSIVIDNGEDTSARVNAFLHLSKNLPIDLHILYPDILWSALRLVLKQNYRIRAIIVTRSGSNRPESFPFKELLDFLDEGSPTYPQMEEYIVGGYQGHGRYNFLWRCPNLVRVRFLLKTTFFFLVYIKKLWGKPIEFPVIISDTDDLKILDEAIYLTSPHIKNKRAPDTVQPQFRGRSQHLEGLHYVMYRDGQIDSLLSTVYPRLHSLTAEMSPAALQVLIGSIQLFPNLKNLDLYLHFRDTTSIAQTPKIVDGPQLYTFTLRSHPSIESQDTESIINDISQTQILRHTRSLTFRLSNSVASPPLMNLLRTAPEIQVLTISRDHYNGPTDYPPVSLPKLEILNLTNLADFWHLEAPNLRSLSIAHGTEQPSEKNTWRGEKLVSLSTDSGSFDQLRGHILQNEPKCQLFPSLTHVKWTKYDGFQTTLLTTITCVTFNSPTIYDGNYKMAPIDAFCLNILQDPDTCPALETIMSQDYPCWDLFLQVLQLRNDNPLVGNIKSVGLPGYPVVVILEALVHILNGGRDKVGQLGEIEGVIQKQLACRNACVQCLLSGYTHCRLTDPLNSTIPLVDGLETELDPPNDLSFPMIATLRRLTQEELERPKQDLKWWNHLINGRSFEKPSQIQMCSRHSPLLITVTQYTLT